MRAMPSSAEPRPGPPRAWYSDPTLWLILLLALSFRLLYITSPLIEAHSWRQITNADIARNLADGPFDLLHPPVNWGGRNGYTGMEFPLFHAVVALLYRTFGEAEILARLTSLAFSLATIVGVFLLGERMFDRSVGRGAAFLVAVSPSAAFFGRTFLSDTPMLCFSVWAVWGWLRYFATGLSSHAATASLLTALACLVKIPAVLVLAPIAVAGWLARGWRVYADRRAVAGIACALLATALWYWQAERIYQQTGLTQSIWHPSGTYAADVFSAARQGSGVSHWGSLERLTTYDFYGELIDRIYSVHLTPLGFLLAGVGLFVAITSPARRVLDAWLAAVIAFVFATAEGQYWHEFHQLPLIPVAALYFGLATRGLFDGPTLARLSGVRWSAVGVGAVLGLGSLLTFQDSGVIATLYRPDRLDFDTVRVGRAIERVVQADQLVVANQYETNGNNSPILLYHARRKGWSFDVRSLTPQLLERLRLKFDAHFFATTDWDLLRRLRPETASYLETHTEIPLADVPSAARLFDLRTPLTP